MQILKLLPKCDVQMIAGHYECYRLDETKNREGRLDIQKKNHFSCNSMQQKLSNRVKYM